MSKIQQNFNTITNILILSILILGGTIWADNNGVWIKASDVQGGIFGNDELENDFEFVGDLSLNLNSCDTLDTDINGKIICGIDKDTNTNAQTICTGGNVLNGNGDCVGNYDGYAPDTNTWRPMPTTCTGTQKLTWDGSTITCSNDINTDTNTQLSKSTVKSYIAEVGYSIGPHITDTNAQTKCGNDKFLRGDGSCVTVASTGDPTDELQTLSQVLTRGNNGGNQDLTNLKNIYAKTYAFSSDKNLKYNISNLNSSLEKILNLRGVSFNWKNTNESDLGVIAQEIETIYPELVLNNGEYKSVKYANLVAPLIESIKELNEKIEKIENSNKELEKKMEKYKK